MFCSRAFLPFLWLSFAVALCACSKSEDVAFEIDFEPGLEGHRIEVYVGEGCAMEGDPIRFQMGDTWPSLDIEEGQTVSVVATNIETCASTSGCSAPFAEGEPVAVMLSTRSACGEMCCDGFCTATSCGDFDAGLPRDGGLRDGGLRDSGPGDALVDPPTDEGSPDSGPPPCGALNILDVSVGQGFSCAMASGGDVYCWGDNQYGQVTPGTPTAGNEPVTRVDFPVDLTGSIAQLEAGDEHVCVRTSDREIYCWGNNAGGGPTQNRLGVRESGETISTNELNAANARFISVGAWHSCAMTSTPLGVRCWGQNASGELGRGNNRPDQVLDVTDPWRNEDAGYPSLTTRVLAGFGNSCVYFPGGAASDLMCWGYDGNGAVGQPRLGDPQWVHRNVSLPSAAYDIIHMLSASHTVTPRGCSNQTNDLGGTTCGVFEDESTAETALFCWGSSACGQLGNEDDDTFVNTPQLSNFPIGSRDWILGVGGGTVCAASRDVGGAPRPLFCWGDGSDSKLLGPAEVGDASEAIMVQENVNDVSVGTTHICSVGVDRRVYCWGGNDNGQAMPGSTSEVSMPTCVPIPAI